MQSGAEGHRHQFVIGRMIIDGIDALAVAIVRAQLRQVAVGLIGKQLYALAAHQLAQLVRPLSDPCGAFALDRRAQDAVLLPGVVAGEQRRLVA